MGKKSKRSAYEFLFMSMDYNQIKARNGTLLSLEEYLYTGYLQVACIDALNTSFPFKYTVLWDPTEPVATRPLALLKEGIQGETYWTYGHDFTKNVTELFDREGNIAHTYDYSPYGQVIAETSGEDTLLNPFQWSSEHRDRLTELVYYNFRYYNPYEGRWTSRDPLMEQYDHNLYRYAYNNPAQWYDALGREPKPAAKPDRPIDPSKPIDSYNCAGLAFRDYKWRELKEVEEILEKCKKSDKGEKCEKPNCLKIVLYAMTKLITKDGQGNVLEKGREELKKISHHIFTL